MVYRLQTLKIAMFYKDMAQMLHGIRIKIWDKE